MDELVASRGEHWPRREEFILRNFERHLRADVDPATAAFIDGSVLNNRPFREAIAAIHNRSAYRDVDRRLIFIDANPGRSEPETIAELPNFFSTIKGALSDLPSEQPIANELAWVVNLNAQARSIKSIIDGARPHVSELVGDIIDKPLDGRFTAEDIRGWRERVNARVAREAGFAHEGYVATEARLGSRLRRPHHCDDRRRAAELAGARAPWKRSSTRGRSSVASSTASPGARRSSTRLRPRPGCRPGSNSSSPSTSIIAGGGCIF